MRKQLEQLPPSHIHRKNTAITYLGQMGRNHISSYSEIECRLPVHRSSARASEIRDLEQKESTGISICLSCDSTANGCRSATQSSLVWTETVAPLNTTHAPALEKGKDEQTVHCHGDMSLVVCHRICAGKCNSFKRRDGNDIPEYIETARERPSVKLVACGEKIGSPWAGRNIEKGT